jgi:hypothetical protein
MSLNKPSVGFTTPAKQIEDLFAEAQNELAKTKTDWQNLFKQFDKLYDEERKRIVETPRPEGETLSDAELTGLSHLFNAVVLTRLGIELAEVHERLVKCEKGIQELKLARK